MAKKYTPFQKEMKSRGGFRSPRGFMHDMDPTLFDAYHGTNQMGLKEILPAQEHGNVIHGAISKRDRTYFMDTSHLPPEPGNSSETGAWTWARSAAGVYGGRPTVYRTIPMGPVSEDTNLYPEEGAFTTSRQVVRSEISTPPPAAFSKTHRLNSRDIPKYETPIGVQGTFPGQDWTHYGPQFDQYANFKPIYSSEMQPKPEPPQQKRSEVPGQQSLKL